MLRESVLPKLVRGSVVLPTRPRYRLGGVITADGGRLFELRARHGDLVVARIGIGWRDYGADLVWQACASGAVNEPPRPWLVEVLEQASIARLNSHEAVGIVHWVSALARDLAWAVMDGHIFWRGPATAALRTVDARLGAKPSACIASVSPCCSGLTAPSPRRRGRNPELRTAPQSTRER